PPSSIRPPKLSSLQASHTVGCPVRQLPQRPQWANDITTWSPGARASTPSPTRSTIPDPSCPSTIGYGDTARSRPTASVWQTPVATTLTSTPPGPGPDNRTSSSENGAPWARVTAAWIFIVELLSGLPPSMRQHGVDGR